MNPLVAQNGDVILCVNISKLYNSKERGSIYEVTRKYWPIAKENLLKITHVAGVFRGKVVVVYVKPSWYRTENLEWPNRWEFTHQDEEGDLHSPYLGKSIRMYGPTRYVE